MSGESYGIHRARLVPELRVKGAKMTAIHRTEYQRKETCIKREFHRSSEVPFQQSEYQHRHVKKLRCGNNARKK